MLLTEACTAMDQRTDDRLSRLSASDGRRLTRVRRGMSQPGFSGVSGVCHGPTPTPEGNRR